MKWPSRASALALVAGLAVLLGSCHQPRESSPKITIETEIAPQPARVGQATITFRLTDETGKPVTKARVAMEGNMSHPGMSPELGEAREIEPGRYQGQLMLSMAGDWVVLLHLTLSNGLRLERQFEIKGVRSG